jgi:hypothetical protein
METEKVCVNLPPAELGKIDLLVAQGLYSSRTDVIRAGIREVFEEHEDVFDDLADVFGSPSPRIGYQILSKGELETAKGAGRRLEIVCVGVLRIGPTVTPELADQTIERIRIFGALRGPKEVLKILEPRVVRGMG